MLDQTTELIDKTMAGYIIKAHKEGETVKIICRSGTRTLHSYYLDARVWREIPDNGKLHFNRLVFLDKKVPQMLGIGISNTRSKLMDAEVRLIVRILNE